MESLRHNPTTLSVEQIDSVNMTVLAEEARLKTDGIITYGDKYAFIYDVFGGPIETDRIPDQVRQQREGDETTRRIRRLFAVSDEEIAGIFSDSAQDELKKRVDKVAAFAAILFRLEEGDHARIFNTLTTPFPALNRGHGDRTFETCIRNGEIDWILFYIEPLLAYSHNEI